MRGKSGFACVAPKPPSTHCTTQFVQGGIPSDTVVVSHAAKGPALAYCWLHKFKPLAVGLHYIGVLSFHYQPMPVRSYEYVSQYPGSRRRDLSIFRGHTGQSPH